MAVCKTVLSSPVQSSRRSCQPSGQQEVASKTSLPDHDPSCFLCPANKRAEGAVNPDYASTFVFVNDFSAVKEVQEAYQPHGPASDLLRAEAVTGKCYVVTFSPLHNITLAD